MTSRLRTALVGCGKVGQLHARALSTLPESELVAVCDPNAERARAFAEQYGGVPCTDVDTLLHEVRPDVLTIATPHPLHAQPTIAAAARGIHVLVEKPLASSLADCDAIIAAAQAGNVTVGVISQRRHYLPVQRIRQAIDAGKIGRPILGLFLMYSWRDEAYYRSDPWRGQWATEGGGVLVNQSPHQLDMLQWFMGPIDEVWGSWANLNHPYIEVEDSAVATVRFTSGAIAAIVASLSQKPGIYTKVHVHGSNGATVGVQTDTGATFVAGVSEVEEAPFNDLWTVPGEESQLSQYQEHDRAAFRAVHGTSHYHRLDIQAFLQAVAAGQPAPVTAVEGRTVVAIFQAIYRSSKERVPIKFPMEA